MLSLAITIAFSAMSLITLEVIWMRLFAIESFSSFGSMFLSIGLLGFGIGGVMVSLKSDSVKRHKRTWLYIAALAYPLGVLLAIWVAKTLPFVPQNVLQDRTQLIYVFIFYMVLSLPFISGSTIIGVILTTAGEKVGKMYRADLVGSGLAGILVLGAFYWIHPDLLPLVVIVLFTPALVAASASMTSIRPWIRWGAPGLVLAVSLTGLVFGGGLNISEYKGISYALASGDVTGAKVVEEDWGPLGYLQVVQSTSERSAPGLSTMAQVLPPVQKGLYIDGNKVASMVRAVSREEATYRDWMLSSIPYRLKKNPEVLVVGLGGGEGVAQALHFDVKSVDVVEMNEQLVSMVKHRFKEENGDILGGESVRTFVGDARDHARRHPDTYDIIQFTNMDASGLSMGTGKSVGENYLVTRESMKRFLAALHPGGIFVVNTRVSEPPRSSLRLVNTVIDSALELWSREDVAGSVAFYRSEFNGMMLLKRGPFTEDEIAELGLQAFERGFTLSFYPGMDRTVLEQRAAEEDAYWDDFQEESGIDLSEFESGEAKHDPFFDLISAALTDDSDWSSYIRQYPFNISVPHDNRPFFSALLKEGTLDFVEKGAYNPDKWMREIPPDLWGQPMMLVTLLQALVFSLLIIFLPLLLGRGKVGRGGRWRIYVYFSCLAVGYMFVEMVLIQKLTLYVAAPSYATAVVLSGMLVFSGLGAGFSSRFADNPRRGIALVVAAIAVLAVIYNLALTPMLLATIGWGESLKVAFSISLIAPIAFVLGMPFPLGMVAVTSTRGEAAGGWGWAVNGAVSVVGIVLAQTLAVHFGFPLVFWLVVAVYLLAFVSFPLLRPAR